MAHVDTYVNFKGNTEEAFNYYAKVFGTEIISITRMGDMPAQPGQTLQPEDVNKIMNIQLPTIGGHILMGTDALESQGHFITIGNNVTISLNVDSREEADRIYNALAVNSPEGSGMFAAPWGAYWGSCEDQFGIRWMVSSPL